MFFLMQISFCKHSRCLTLTLQNYVVKGKIGYAHCTFISLLLLSYLAKLWGWWGISVTAPRGVFLERYTQDHKELISEIIEMLPAISRDVPKVANDLFQNTV